MSINFSASPQDSSVIFAIVERAHRETQIGDLQDRLTTTMDLTAVNNSVGLRLHDMLRASASDFAHDIYGIRQNLNRRTGELGCFLPRYAAQECERTAA